ncbi:MAG: DUF5686 and carboxypeptidase regulatory-like domain-containing protein, partial [Bacteroidia bacterium]|nr:DUF5686 and carboxypeptidase regulatory-like domain-containing protein [Bacteroidia bacterium]
DLSTGTSTNMDGKFAFPPQLSVQTIAVSYVGYEKIIVTPTQTPFTIQLRPANIQLAEIAVFPGENPAHRIIKNCSNNRKKNNPEELESFQYQAYHKMHFTAELPPNDSGAELSEDAKNLREFFDKSNIMLIESVSERTFINPKNSEKVLASRISGLQDPLFSLLSSQLQSFSFYNDYFSLGDKKYLNPISTNSTNSYFFLLEDTLFQGNDSVFVISYRPRKNTNFDGLKGILYIHSAEWAIQQVIAEAMEEKGATLKIQQQYEKVAGHWFPIQLNTDLRLNNLTKGIPLLGVGRTYIKNIKINDQSIQSEFNRFDLEIDSKSLQQNQEIWQKYRVDSLSEKDWNTYRYLDSLSQIYNFEKKLKALKTIANGKIPIGFIDLDLEKIIGANDYEGFRLGLGANTNAKLSRFLSLAGYFCYGTRDKAWKYGGSLDLQIDRKNDIAFTLVYKHDLQESGGSYFLADRKTLFTETLRKTFDFRRDFSTRYDALFKFRIFQYALFQVGVSRQQIKAVDNYSFGIPDKPVYLTTKSYDFNEALVGLKFAFRERFVKSGDDIFSKGTQFPILYITATKGFRINAKDIPSAFDYWRIEARIEDDFFIRKLGKQTFCLQGGMVWGNLPYTKLFAGRSGWYKFPVATQNYFETMRSNEFLTDRYLALFHRHNFGELLIKTKYFSPEIILVNNLGFGWLSNPENHHDVSTRDYKHGYFETGVVLDNILKINFAGYGAGIYYRYGAYQNAKAIDNWAFKLSLNINLTR